MIIGAIFLFTGCSDNPRPFNTDKDGNNNPVDAGEDGYVKPDTGGEDAGFDAGSDPGSDPGYDAGGSDPGYDAGGSDPGYDAGYDAGGSDPGYDAGYDAGHDAGHDAGSDPGDTGLTDICDEVVVEAEPVRPNLFLVIDRSGSMEDPIHSGGNETKLDDTKTAIFSLLNWGEDKIRFGMMRFPWLPTLFPCSPGQVEVECSNDSAGSIRTAMLLLTPNGGTPTGPSLDNAYDYQGLHDQYRDSFVVLLTDGCPTCPNGGGSEENQADNQRAIDAIDDLHWANIDTFVIGIGEDVNNTNPALLNEFAIHGGRPRPGSVKYYPANSLAELEQALQDIGEQVAIECELQLDRPPDIPEWLWVYLDGVPAHRDPTHQDGWDYDEATNRIIFYGPMCDLLLSGQVTNVEVKVGCAPPI
jgi:hypothetical protein